MKYIFLDTETTGKEKDDCLIQIAYKSNEIVVNELFKPTKKIEIEAMAVHHITEKMVMDKPLFKNSKVYEAIEMLLDENILIAHNASFDVDMLKREDIETKNVICTRKVASVLDTNGSIGSYGLQYLRYYLDLDVEGIAHDALGDVLVLEKLFHRLLSKMKVAMNEEDAIAEMLKISSQPMLIRQFKFGKHNGKTVKEILETNRDYLQWLLEQKLAKPDGEEDWIFTLQHYLQARED